jgi:hypothetical protein
MNKNLGVLHRAVKYKNIYDSMFDPDTLSFIIARGWFPFAELINDGFDILQYQEKMMKCLINQQAILSLYLIRIEWIQYAVVGTAKFT